MPTREDFLRRWETDARLGVTPSMNHPEYRRVVLVNQTAMLAGFLTIAYGLMALFYNLAVFWPLVAATPVFLAAYAGVLWLDSARRFLTARIVLVLVPAVQITFATWLFSTGAGIQLHFFVLWTALFLLYTPKELWLSISAAVLWISLYIWLQIAFKEPALDLHTVDGILGLDILDVAFAISSITAFGLVGLTISLFYREIQRTEALLQREHQRSRDLLDNILPNSVAKRLLEGHTVFADSADDATLLFADLVGFTRLAGKLPPSELVNLLNDVFSQFDRIVERHGLEKIKTIGDEYMLAGGLPRPRSDHAQAVADAALDMLTMINDMNDRSEHSLELRVGIHTGEVVAGVIGSRKFSYDVWGDTVNTASRMQTHGLPGHIQITEETAHRLQPEFELARRGTIRVRGKGRMPAWFVLGRKAAS